MFQRIYMSSNNSMTATAQKQKQDTRWSDICPAYFCTWCFLLACVALQHCTVQQKTLEKEASLIVLKLFWKFGSDQASLQKRGVITCQNVSNHITELWYTTNKDTLTT